MSNHSPQSSVIRNQFRSAAKSICRTQVEGSEKDIVSHKGNTKSYAQVESLVLPPNSGELKLRGITKKRPSPFTIRLSENQKQIVRNRARSVGASSVNEYAKAALLGSDYRPAQQPELVERLLDLNRELIRQGTNLNQIAWQLNGGIISPEEAQHFLNEITPNLSAVHAAVLMALADGGMED